jgi:uncharacterized protein
VAVLGILAMNMYAFAMPYSAYNNPLMWGGTGTASKLVWFLTYFVFDQKFLPVFSMLFGAGLILMTERSGAGRFAGTWYRRNLWLVMIGAAHAYLIWWGDILFSYAILGLLIYPLRRRKAKTLITLGAIWMLPPLVLSTASSVWMEKTIAESSAVEERAAVGEELNAEEQKTLDSWYEMRPMLAPTAADLEADVRAYLGSYGEIVKHRIPTVLMMQTIAMMLFSLWRMGGLMLIGMGLMKLEVFSAQKSEGFYLRMLIWGYGLGLPLVAISAWRLSSHDWSALFFHQQGVHWNYIASVPVSLGHISLILLAVKRFKAGALTRRLVAVGRMAFTNYLMQSVLCTFLFYGYGFGFYGKLERPAQMVVVVAVWVLQLMYSGWWLDRFRYGPAEWFWRFLTYGKSPSFRRETAL